MVKGFSNCKWKKKIKNADLNFDMQVNLADEDWLINDACQQQHQQAPWKWRISGYTGGLTTLTSNFTIFPLPSDLLHNNVLRITQVQQECYCESRENSKESSREGCVPGTHSCSQPLFFFKLIYIRRCVFSVPTMITFAKVEVILG